MTLNQLVNASFNVKEFEVRASIIDMERKLVTNDTIKYNHSDVCRLLALQTESQVVMFECIRKDKIRVYVHTECETTFDYTYIVNEIKEYVSRETL